jgi:hypothetical protein
MIYVNGDSWSRNLWISWSPEDWSWPKQLSDNLGIEIFNESQGCGSNSKILADILRNYFLGHRYDLVVIGLSTPYRWHLPAKNMSSWVIGPTILHDRTYKEDKTILPWWSVNCLNDLEYLYQYYNIIWQIDEICKNYFKCPVLFFNAWDSDIYEFDKILQSDDTALIEWLKLKFQPLNEKEYDYRWDSYVQTFKFFKSCRNNWKFESKPWSSFLSESDYDGMLDRDPHHPSKNGHKMICEYILPFVKNLINCTKN